MCPAYQYKCEKCGNTFEQVFPLNKFDSKPDCPKCGWRSKKIMTFGGIQTDHPVWLDNSIIRQLQDTDDPNARLISSRSEYNQYLKDNGLQPTG